MSSNVTYLTNSIVQQMSVWRNTYYQEVVYYLAQQCTCGTGRISCVEIDPREKPDYDAGYVFFGPNNIMIGEIRWKRNGRCTDFLVYDENLLEVRRYLAKKRAERARAKSVNKSLEEAKSREQPFKKGLEELAYVIKRNVKEAVAIGAFVAVMATSMFSMHNILNPDYINDSYTSGYQAVNYETHRTNDNGGYWYDYSDIAGRYEETMDFDSYVYGTYKNVGWNRESKIDCMNTLFSHFHSQGITAYTSFKDYCMAKGACVEKDGRMVIDTGLFCNIMEEYMESLNKVNEFNNDNKGIGRL